MRINKKRIDQFKKIIWQFYKKNKRDLPWRKTIDPYRILVSEVMLQQTQVSRVLQKYPLFIKKFPNFKALRKASLKEVLSVWQGMGYNRRALYLKKIAQIVVDKYQGKLPQDPKVLDFLPGVGRASAHSVYTFVFNQPSVFIETNVRRVYIHHFFHGKDQVDDKEILPLVKQTVDKKNPRQWYFALMDYGAMLGRLEENQNKRSKHYGVQSKFEGSNRQIRGQIIKALLSQGLSLHRLTRVLPFQKEGIIRNVQILKKEGLIKEKNRLLFVS